MRDIDSLHYSTSQEEFYYKKFDILDNWSRPLWSSKIYKQLIEFRDYFIKQWLEGFYCNWQLFNRPAGFASTNNPEEQFNGDFKQTYTGNERCTVGRICDVLCKCVYDCSTKHANRAFATVAPRDNGIIKAAKERYTAADFTVVNANTLYYNLKDETGRIIGYKYSISLSPRYCSCSWFLDVANCRHYVAASILMGYVDEHDKEFVIAKGRGRPKGARGALKK